MQAAVVVLGYGHPTFPLTFSHALRILDKMCLLVQ